MLIIIDVAILKDNYQYLFDDLDLDELFTDLVCICMALTFELLLCL